MDDFIYILIGVFWVIFTIMRKSQKKQGAVSYDGPTTVQQKTGSFDEVIRELLGATEPEIVETSAPTLEEKGIESSNEQFTLETIDSEIQTGEVLESLEDEIQSPGYTSISFDEEPEEPDENQGSYVFDFDIKRAVVYSIILDRPYA
jgi:hypothetical protein